MSEENRPNLNAVGLVVDIMESIEKHKRGNARKNPKSIHVIEILKDEILDFIEVVNDKLNDAYGE